jgi:hypothetical protein
MKYKTLIIPYISLAKHSKPNTQIWRFLLFFLSLLAIENLQNHFILNLLILNFANKKKTDEYNFVSVNPTEISSVFLNFCQVGGLVIIQQRNEPFR